nr:hypothetical protein [Tanacetum cinerariifolium]
MCAIEVTGNPMLKNQEDRCTAHANSNAKEVSTRLEVADGFGLIMPLQNGRKYKSIEVKISDAFHNDTSAPIHIAQVPSIHAISHEENFTDYNMVKNALSLDFSTQSFISTWITKIG